MRLSLAASQQKRFLFGSFWWSLGIEALESQRWDEAEVFHGI